MRCFLLVIVDVDAEIDDATRAREIYKVTLADLQRDLQKNVLPIPTLILYQVMTSLTSTCKFSVCLTDDARSRKYISFSGT